MAANFHLTTEEHMSNLARNMDSTPVTHETGVVVPSAHEVYNVRTHSGVHRAKRAVSCLVAPRAGDSVTIALTRRGAYVTAVLERAVADAATTIAVDGDLELAIGGRFDVSAPAGIELTSSHDLRVAADRVAFHAQEANLAVGRTTIVGKFLLSQVEHVKQVASAIDVVAERVSQTVERCYRFVAKHDQLRAETIDYKADEAVQIHGRNAVVTAHKLVKIDGDQIHLG
jgi:hypothetical protein